MSGIHRRLSAETCDRRHFLQIGAVLTLGALGGLAEDTHPSGTVVMALGGAGINIARRVQQQDLPSRYWIWNRDGQVIGDQRVLGASRVDVPGSLLEGSPHHAVADWIDIQLADFRTTVRRVAVVAGLGGRTGTILLPAVAHSLAATGHRVGTYCILPAAFEGEVRTRTAAAALAALRDGGALPRSVRLDDVVRSAAAGTTLRDVLDAADGRLARSIIRFLRPEI